MRILHQKSCATLENTVINMRWKVTELWVNWCIWESNKNILSSNIRAHPLELSEEMRSEHSPREGLVRCLQKKSGDISAFVLISSHLSNCVQWSCSGRQAQRFSKQSKTIRGTTFMRRGLGQVRKMWAKQTLLKKMQFQNNCKKYCNTIFHELAFLRRHLQNI